MRRNLDLTGGLVMAERIAYAAAPRGSGSSQAQAWSSTPPRARGSEGVAFRQALADSEGLGLTLDEIDAAARSRHRTRIRRAPSSTAYSTERSSHERRSPSSAG